MILLLYLDTRSFKHAINLLLNLCKLVRKYVNLKTVSTIYFSIKLLYNEISIPMGLLHHKIPILTRIYFFRIRILMGLFHSEIPIVK